MKKKNLLLLAMGTIALSLGLTSCKKNKNCAIFTDADNVSYCYCVGDDGITQAEFDSAVRDYQSLEGYSVKFIKSCR